MVQEVSVHIQGPNSVGKNPDKNSYENLDKNYLKKLQL